MGAADLVPGVSGGTIAFVSGIYDRLLLGIRSIDLDALRLLVRGQWRDLFARVPVTFFVALGAGLLTAIFSLSRLIYGLFQSHPVQLWAFFFGLVLGSILLLARETWRWRPIDAIAFVVAGLATYWLVGLDTMQTPPNALFLFLAGAIAICAMILPGISGSYLLVIMGKYHQVLEAVNHRDFASLAIFVAGIAVGILSFVRIVSWLLRTWRQVTLVALTGIMAGALRTVWPWKEVVSTRVNSQGVEVPLMQVNVAPENFGQVGGAIVLALFGALLVAGLSRLSPDHRPRQSN